MLIFNLYARENICFDLMLATRSRLNFEHLFDSLTNSNPFTSTLQHKLTKGFCFIIDKRPRRPQLLEQTLEKSLDIRHRKLIRKADKKSLHHATTSFYFKTTPQHLFLHSLTFHRRESSKLSISLKRHKTRRKHDDNERSILTLLGDV